jgi:N-acetylglucosamine malate deacetylase 1
MALLRNQKYDKDTPDPAMRAKEALASYRGQACGVRYAEAVWAMSPSPRDIL